MKIIDASLRCSLMIMLLLGLIVSCDNPTEPKKDATRNDAICFVVYGHTVTVHNFWDNGDSYSDDIGGRISFDQTTSRNNEAHTLEWTNIVSDQNRAYSFDVKIDGEDYSYPKDRCSLEDEIVFAINGEFFNYREGCGRRSYPHGFYIGASDYTSEQYQIIGSATTADCEDSKNTITISFIKYSNWELAVIFYDGAGDTSYFFTPIDTSMVEFADTVGEQISADIPGPITSSDGASTLTDLSFRVEMIDVPQPEPTGFVNHNTGSLEVSIYENGNMGHICAECPGDKGRGVRFKGSTDALYNAGFILGTTARGSVNGHIVSLGISNELINTVPMSELSSSPPDWDQTAEASFNDNGAPDPYGIDVTQVSSSNTGENFMFVHYRLHGNGTSLSDLYVGIFADWDVGKETYDSNLGGYDAARNMAYQYLSGGTNDPNYYGIIALSGMSGARVTLESPYVLARDSSFAWIATFLNEPITTPGDYRMWIGSGPFTLSAQGTVEAYFSIVAGSDLSDLNVNADAAIQKYESTTQ